MHTRYLGAPEVIPGAGPALATALVASIPDPKVFRSGRDISAWIGLVPKQNSSGGKDRLGNISKRGDRYLRSLFTTGALAVIRYAKIHGTRHRPWLTPLLAQRRLPCLSKRIEHPLDRLKCVEQDPTGQEGNGMLRSLLNRGLASSISSQSTRYSPE
jgi:hypothetical protein